MRLRSGILTDPTKAQEGGGAELSAHASREGWLGNAFFLIPSPPLVSLLPPRPGPSRQFHAGSAPQSVWPDTYSILDANPIVLQDNPGNQDKPAKNCTHTSAMSNPFSQLLRLRSVKPAARSATA
jgi:hypothetical protein